MVTKRCKLVYFEETMAGGRGEGVIAYRFVKLPKTPQMASALDHKRYLWCVHTHVRRGRGLIFCNFRALVHTHAYLWRQIKFL